MALQNQAWSFQEASGGVCTDAVLATAAETLPGALMTIVLQFCWRCPVFRVSMNLNQTSAVCNAVWRSLSRGRHGNELNNLDNLNSPLSNKPPADAQHGRQCLQKAEAPTTASGLHAIPVL